MHNYTPGQHILSTFRSSPQQLTAMVACQDYFGELILSLGLQKVGEAFHSFNNGGFTGVVCLTESHASIHTWPEFGLATFDVFLSNFNRDNTSKARAFYERTLNYFNAESITMQEVTR